MQVAVILLSNAVQPLDRYLPGLLNGFFPNLAFCEGKLDVVVLGLLLYFLRKKSQKDVGGLLPVLCDAAGCFDDDGSQPP